MTSTEIKKRNITANLSTEAGDVDLEDVTRTQGNREGQENETNTAEKSNEAQPEKPFDPFFGLFDGWTMLEKYFFFILLMILFYQLHIFSFFHIGARTVHAYDVMSVDHGIAPGIDFETVDTRGQNWVPVYDRETQICMNLDSLIKVKGDVTTTERKQWKDYQCPDRLKGLYSQWCARGFLTGPKRIFAH